MLPRFWECQSIINEKLFLANFEQRLKDTFIQNCISDVESSHKCRIYREIKTVYKCENYMDCNKRHDLRMYYTMYRMSITLLWYVNTLKMLGRNMLSNITTIDLA